MLTTFFDYEWEYWTTIGKVTFDGVNKLIIVNEGVTELDIRQDVYSAWINWIEIRNNTRFPLAMRFTGLDAIPGGYTGDSYFLTNGWRLMYDPNLVNVFGVLYSDDYDTPTINYEGKPVYPAKVAALVSTSTITTTTPALTAANIADLVSAVWDAKIADYLSVGSTGAKLNETTTGQIDDTAILTAISNQTTTINDHTDTAVSGVSVDTSAITTAITASETNVTDAIASQTISINAHTDTAVQSAAIDTTPITNAITAQTTTLQGDITTATSSINSHTDTAVSGIAATLEGISVDNTPVLDAIATQTTTINSHTDSALAAQTISINAHTDIATDLVAVDDTAILNSIANQTTTLQGNIEGIKDNINAHTTLETSSITFANTDVYDYIDAQTVALSTHVSNEVNGIPATDLTPVLNAIAALNDPSLAEIEASTVLAKQSRLEDVVTLINALPTDNLDVNLTPVLTAISALNDVTAAEVRAEFAAADFQNKNTEAEIHAWLDSYANKDTWKATVDLSPILAAIGALENLSLIDIEGSTALAKQSTLLSVATAIAAIPTTDSTTDLTPVLNAIAALNDVTPAEVRAAFDPLDFKDKNTEAEIHAWLGTYPNKDQWKASTIDLSPVLVAIQSLNNLSLADFETSNIFAKESTLASIASSIAAIPTTDSVTDITPVLDAIANLNDVTPAEVRAAFNAVEFQSKNTEAEIHAWLNSYTNKAAWKADPQDLTPIIAAIQSLENISVADIEASAVLAKQTTVDSIVTLVSALENTDLGPVLNAISGLNDVTAAEVRAAFNVAEFKDKNTEAEVHAWLDSYTNKDNWKSSATDVANAVWEQLI